MKNALFILGIIAVIPIEGFAAIIHVPADELTVQAGIDAAMDGDTVLVADGTYTGEGNIDIDFNGKSITVISQNGAENCIIDCKVTGENHRGFYFHSNEHLGSVVQGFTIINGNLSGSPWSMAGGAGIRCEAASPKIVKCIIKYNNAQYGGGIYLFESNAMIMECQIFSNWAYQGAGISCDNSSASFTNCEVYCNQGTLFNHAGGLDCNGCSLTLVGCEFHANGKGPFGEDPISVSLDGNDTSCFINCIISFYASDDWYRNRSVVKICGTPFFINCTLYFVLEESAIYCASGFPVFHNCIIYLMHPTLHPFLFDESSYPIVDYCFVSARYPGIGNISGDVCMTVGEFPYYLTSRSICIDAGSDVVALPIDKDGNPRFQGGGVDMGAYEFDGWPSITRTYIKMPSHHFTPGDLVSCTASVWNPNDYSLDQHQLFVLLDIFGEIFMAPSFTAFDYYTWSFNTGKTDFVVLPDFMWPEDSGSASGLVWYAFLINPETMKLASRIAVFDFGWSE